MDDTPIVIELSEKDAMRILVALQDEAMLDVIVNRPVWTRLEDLLIETLATHYDQKNQDVISALMEPR